MKAYRVWAVWNNAPEDNSMMLNAYEWVGRAQVLAYQLNTRHQEKVGPNAQCKYVVREEVIPRPFVFNDAFDPVMTIYLKDDKEPTKIGWMLCDWFHDKLKANARPI